MKFFVPLFLALGCTAFGQTPDIVGQNAVFDFVQKATEITLYSLDPSEPNLTPPAKVEKAVEKLQGYTVFGKIPGTPNELRERIRTILVSAVVSPEEVYECFSPRLGLSLVYQGRRLDILLCYQCHQSRFYIEGQWEEGPLGNTGEAEFNALLDQRGIKRDIPKPRPAPEQK